MNILHISSSSELSGGGEFRLLEIIEEEKSRGISPTVILPDRGSLTDALFERDVTSYIISSYPWIHSPAQSQLYASIAFAIKRILNMKAEAQVFNIIKKEKIDLVHINTSANSLSYKTAYRNEIPIVWHVREFNDARKPFVFYDEKMSKRLISSSRAVVFVSNVLAESYADFTSPEKVHVIYDDAKRPTQKRVKELFSENIVKVAIINDIYPAKNQLDALLALEYMPLEIRRRFKLIIVGKCVDKSYYQEMSSFIKENALEDMIEFRPFTKNVYLILQDCDIALNCSISEALPGATIEGMIAGCLTIGNDTTGIRELLDDGRGLLYSNEHENNLSQRLMFVLDNIDKCRKIAEVGKAFSDENFRNGSKELVSLFESFKVN